MGEPATAFVLDLHHIEAVIFDMDGVITDTASVHAAAWQEMFDAYLADRALRTGEVVPPFEPDDYLRFVDGRARYDGVRSFLASRGITLAEGEPSDPPTAETVAGLGNRKDRLFLERVHGGGVRPFASSVRLVRSLRDRGAEVAVVSASRNMAEVLAGAGIADLFGTHVDGRDAETRGLPGKPDPAVFLEAANRLGVEPFRAAIVEDSQAGVEAGRRGGFGLVIGVDRTGQPHVLRDRGADLVVGDLGEVTVVGGAPSRRAGDLDPPPGDARGLEAPFGAKRPAVFLDYDGTLTPIVRRPELATLSEGMREALRMLADRVPVAIVSGRDLDDVRAMVGIPGIAYAGSHGFDILLPDGERRRRGEEFDPALDAAERDLRDAVADGVPGSWVDRKRFAVAVHFREMDPALVSELDRRVGEVAARHPELRRTGGKMIFELRPDVAWDKGRALRFLLSVLGLDGSDVVPVYVGDDETDEDAFRTLQGDGLGIVVAGDDDDRPTRATLRLPDPSAVEAFLRALAASRPPS